jgi:hypothetical protein
MARKPVALTEEADEASTAPASAWQSLDDSAALESQALQHAQCDDAASACWYLCRSLGLARQLEPGEPSLELLFELIGALADLPADICAQPLPSAVTSNEQLGITELCQQLAMAREQSQVAWVDAELAAPVGSLKH